MNAATAYQARDIQQAVADLNSDSELVRQTAIERLRDYMPHTLPALKQAVLQGPSPRAMPPLVELLLWFKEPVVPDMMDALASKKPSARKVAAEVLARIDTPEARAGLIDFLKRWAAQNVPTEEGYSQEAIVFFACVFVLLVALMATQNATVSMTLCVVLLLLLVTLALSAPHENVMETDAGVTHALSVCHSPDLIPTVLTCLRLPELNEVARSHIRQTLCRLLAAATEADFADLTSADRATLTEQLAGSDVDGCLAVIRVTPWIASTAVMEALERLASGRAACSNSSEARKAARECLPAVRVRLEQSQQAERLVRASSGENAQLLRPASGGSAEVETLVRPAKE